MYVFEENKCCVVEFLTQKSKSRLEKTLVLAHIIGIASGFFYPRFKLILVTFSKLHGIGCWEELAASEAVFSDCPKDLLDAKRGRVGTIITTIINIK